jgi:hypothetical protein
MLRSLLGLYRVIGVAGKRQSHIALTYRKRLAYQRYEFDLRIVATLLALVERWIIRIVVRGVLAPRPCGAVRGLGSSGKAPIGIQTEPSQLPERVRVPVVGKFPPCR